MSTNAGFPPGLNSAKTERHYPVSCCSSQERDNDLEHNGWNAGCSDVIYFIHFI